MTDELDTKLDEAVKPIRDKGGDHHGLADVIVAAVKVGIEHLKEAMGDHEPEEPFDTDPEIIAAKTIAGGFKVQNMLAKADYPAVDPTTGRVREEVAKPEDK